MTAIAQVVQAPAEHSREGLPVMVAGQITVDGVRLAGDFGIEIPADEESVWLTRGDAGGRHWRVSQLPFTSRILVEGEDWIMEAGGDGKRVYRGREPHPAA